MSKTTSQLKCKQHQGCVQSCTGLDCGLDCWTGLDWTDGLDYWGEVAFVSTFGALLYMLLATAMPEGAVSSLCVHHELIVHISPCGLWIVQLATSMQWDGELQLVNVAHLIG